MTLILSGIKSLHQTRGDSLRLGIGEDAPLLYDWSCSVTNRLTMIDVTDLQHEIRE
jgi:hypothetical protein